MVARSSKVIALDGFDGRVTPVNLARDALMNRAVEQQITSGLLVGTTTKALRFYRNYLKQRGADVLFVALREKE